MNPIFDYVINTFLTDKERERFLDLRLGYVFGDYSKLSTAGKAKYTREYNRLIKTAYARCEAGPQNA